MNKFRLSIPILFIILFLNNYSPLRATTQLKDKIIYKGKEYSITPNILEPFFNKHPDKRPKIYRESSNLDKGYIAKFEIIDNILYLTDLLVLEQIKSKSTIDINYISVYNTIFTNGKKLKVTWESGILELPYGDLINQYTLPNSIYSNYLVIDFKKGKLIEERNFSFEELKEFREKQFGKFKNSRHYKKLIKSFKITRPRESIDINELDWYIKKKIFDYTDKFL